MQDMQFSPLRFCDILITRSPGASQSSGTCAANMHFSGSSRRAMKICSDLLADKLGDLAGELEATNDQLRGYQLREKHTLCPVQPPA